MANDPAPASATPPSPSPSADGRPQPAAPRGRFRLLRRLLFYVLIGYVVWLFGSCSLQTSLIYPSRLAGPQLPEAALPRELEHVWITAKDSSRVEAWFVAAKGASADHPAPAAIFFHGNAELIDHNLSLVERYHARGHSVLMPEYRGYGRSGGTPAQDPIVADAAAFYDWLAKRPDVDKSRIIIHGRSLGTGVSSQLAALHQPAALILESPFTSIASFAWHYGVPPIFLKSPFHTDRVLPNLSCPILILAGRSDEIIPIEHGHKLHSIAPTSTMVELDGSHNSGLSEQNEYWSAIDRLLAKTFAGAP
jgi:fermentation-respiration switch protein FrsA (DUF1100 family)